MSTAPRPLFVFARQQRILATRSRWTQIFAAVFAALALSVAGSGYVLTGGSGLQDFSRTAVSLVQLVLFIVPLNSLLMGVMALTPDRGAAEMTFSQPVARSKVLFGTLLGLFEALVAAQAIGFGAAGLVIHARTGPEGLAGFLLVFLGSVLICAVFLGLAAVLSVGVGGRKRARALALALVAWFVLVILFDVVVLGIASTLPSGAASRLLIVGVIANPVDAIRTGCLLAIEGAAAFGPASLAFLRFTKGSAGAGALLVVSVLLWTTIPIAAAALRLRRSDI